MDPEHVNKKNKAFRVLIVKPVTKYVDSSYELLCFNHNPITNTGHLKIFELTSKTPGQPTFTGRWDQKAEKLDVDINGATGSATRNFKKEIHGYSGHHPAGISGEVRSFEVNLAFPNLNIFRGIISFGLQWEVEVIESCVAEDDTDAEVIRPHGLRRLFQIIRNLVGGWRNLFMDEIFWRKIGSLLS